MRVVEENIRRIRDFLARRQRDYRLAFNTPAGRIVLADLVKFCRVRETAFSPDPRIHALLEGRREVFLRIANNLNLSVDELYAIARGPQLPQSEDDHG